MDGMAIPVVDMFGFRMDRIGLCLALCILHYVFLAVTLTFHAHSHLKVTPFFLFLFEGEKNLPCSWTWSQYNLDQSYS